VPLAEKDEEGVEISRLFDEPASRHPENQEVLQAAKYLSAVPPRFS
jgi:hypothetical protein